MQTQQTNQRNHSKLWTEPSSCSMFPKAVLRSHAWLRGKWTDGIIFPQNFQSNGPPADFKTLTWKTFLTLGWKVQLHELFSAFCKWNGHSSVKWTGFFNPRLFDLIRPICICSRVMVRMKAAAVIAFSRRIQHPPHLLFPLYCNYSCSLPLQSFAFATNAFVSRALMWDLIK